MPRLSVAGIKHCGKARVCVRARIKANAAHAGGAYLKESCAGLDVKSIFDTPVAEVALLVFKLRCQIYLFHSICSLLTAEV